MQWHAALLLAAVLLACDVVKSLPTAPTDVENRSVGAAATAATAAIRPPPPPAVESLNDKVKDQQKKTNQS